MTPSTFNQQHFNHNLSPFKTIKNGKYLRSNNWQERHQPRSIDYQLHQHGCGLQSGQGGLQTSGTQHPEDER